MTIRVDNVKDLMVGFTDHINAAKKDILTKLSTHVKSSVVTDYVKRVQQLYYPLRNPKTGEILESMPPSEIADFVTKSVFADRAVVYLPPNTEADKSGRMQELWGGRPWSEMRMKMMNLEYLNRVFTMLGMKGIKAQV